MLISKKSGLNDNTLLVMILKQLFLPYILGVAMKHLCFTTIAYCAQTQKTPLTYTRNLQNIKGMHALPMDQLAKKFHNLQIEAQPPAQKPATKCL